MTGSIGTHRLRDRIGQGADTETYRADGGAVVKILDVQAVRDPDRIDAFKEQFRHLHGIDVTGVPCALSLVEEDGRLGMVLQDVGGASLDALIVAKRRFTDADARLMLDSALGVLERLHALSPRVVHGDVVPGNVVVADGSVFLVDLDPRVSADDEGVRRDLAGLAASLVAALAHRRELSPTSLASTTPGVQAAWRGTVNINDATEEVLQRMIDGGFPTAAAARAAVRSLGRARGRRSGVAVAAGFLSAVAVAVGALVAVRTAPAPPVEPIAAVDAPDDPAATLAGTRARGWYGPRDGLDAPTLRWATRVVGFSTQYSEPAWSAARALGPPEVFPRRGDDRRAWASKGADSGLEWITLAFDGATNATSEANATSAIGVAIAESLAPGAIVRVDDVTDGADGRAPLALSRERIVVAEGELLRIDLPQPRQIGALRVVLDTRLVPNWNEIDAVALVLSSDGGDADAPLVRSLRMPSIVASLEGARATLWTDGFALSGTSATTLRWASSVVGRSSEYTSDGWSAARALGPPDVFPRSGDDRNAWAPTPADEGYEHVSVSFGDAPIAARAIVIVETLGAGGVVRIDDLTAADAPVSLWQGPLPGDPARARALRVDLPAPRSIRALRVVVDTRVTAGWEEIDAVALLPR